MNARPSRTRHARLALESLDRRIVPTVMHLYAVGQDIGGASIVQAYNEDGSLNRSFSPFGPGFSGGVRVATGDVTGDGTDDLVVAPGIGGGPEVKVFDGATGLIVRDFFAYESSFRGGVNVAAGDVNGDGKADVVTGTGVGGGPRVQVFDGATGAELANFFAYNSSVRSGVNVAAGDLHGDGTADIVTGVGPGGGPNVRVFDGLTNALEESFFAYDQGFLGGVSVELVHAKGAIDILVAPGPSLGGFVELFDGATGAGVNEFEPFPSYNGGIATGQGVASAAAPFANVFANPVALAKHTMGGSSNDTSGYGAPDGGDYNWGDVVNSSNIYNPPDPGASYVATDSGYVPSSDSSYVASSDTGSYDSGSSYSDDTSGCGCGDSNS